MIIIMVRQILEQGHVRLAQIHTFHDSEVSAHFSANFCIKSNEILKKIQKSKLQTI